MNTKDTRPQDALDTRQRHTDTRHKDTATRHLKDKRQRHKARHTDTRHKQQDNSKTKHKKTGSTNRTKRQKTQKTQSVFMFTGAVILVLFQCPLLIQLLSYTLTVVSLVFVKGAPQINAVTCSHRSTVAPFA
jgi:hypothetical protein